MIRVLIADDNPLVRRGIRTLLGQEVAIEVVGEAGDGLEALERVRDLIPDIALLDIRMPRLDGLQATKQIQDLGVKTRVIVVSLFADDAWVKAAFRYGARGYVLKQNSIQELGTAIQMVIDGNLYFSPGIRAVADVSDRPTLAPVLKIEPPRNQRFKRDRN